MSGTDDKILQIVTKIEDTLSKAEKDQGKLWSQVKDFIGTLANVIQLAGWVVPALSNIASFVKTINTSDQNVSIVGDLLTDDLVIAEITKDFEMKHIAETLAPGMSALTNIQDTLDPMVPPEFFAPAQDLIDVTTMKNKLTQRAFWTRPFVPEAVFSTFPWFSWSPPREPDDPDRVFDPSLSLPALLTATQMYSAATTSLAGIDGPRPLPQAWKDHLNELAKQLDTFYRETVRGIVDVPVPTFEDLIPPGTVVPSTQTNFVIAGAPVGAAFLYSTRHVVDTYPLFGHPNDFDPDPLVEVKNNYGRFNGRFKLGNMARRKALYILLKLHETWEAIQNLRGLAQGTPESVDPNYGWSVTEIKRALEEAFPPDPNQLQGGIRLSEQMSNLRKLVVPPIADDPRLGLRALLTRVTP